MRPDYEALKIYLSAMPKGELEVTLPFSKIAVIIGASLPASHLNYRQWWANQEDASRRPQARAWMDAGFKVDMVEQTDDGWVRFVRR